MISAVAGGTITISDSCFTENGGPTAGVGLITEDSTVIGNTNNYGSGNYALPAVAPFCNGLLLNATQPTCSEFDATTCPLDAVGTTAPAPNISPAPITVTNAPVIITGSPTATTTQAPVIPGETPAPTPSPTNAPVPKQLTTTYRAGNSLSGNMFDLVSSAPIEITSFDLHVNTTSSVVAYCYTKADTYAGFEKQIAAWSFGGSASFAGQGFGIPTTVPNFFNAPIALDPGKKQAFYVTLTTSDILYTNGNQEGRLWIFSPELKFFEGAGVGYPFGVNNLVFSPRIFNGVIHYRILMPTDDTSAPTPAPVTTAQLPTTFNGGSGSFGAMFDVTAIRSLDLREMSIHTSAAAATTTVNALLYTKKGTYKDYEYLTEEWTAIGTAANVMSQGTNNPTNLPSNTFAPVTIAGGGRQAFYVTLDTREIIYTPGSAISQPEGTLYASNDDIRFYVGAGMEYPFFIAYPNRIFNGQLRYSLNPDVAPVPPTPAPFILTAEPTTSIVVPPTTPAPVTPAPVTPEPTSNPIKGPTMSPNNVPSGAPVTPAPVTPEPTSNPIKGPTMSPNNVIPAPVTVAPLVSDGGGPSSPSQPAPSSPSGATNGDDSDDGGGDDNTPIIAGAAAGGAILILTATVGGVMYARRQAGKGRNNGGTGVVDSSAPPPAAAALVAEPMPIATPAPIVASPSVGSSSAATGRTKTVIRKSVAVDGTETITKEIIHVG